MSIKQTLSISAPLPNRWGLNLLTWTPRPRIPCPSLSGSWDNRCLPPSSLAKLLFFYLKPILSYRLFCSPDLSCHLLPTYCSWSKSPPAFHVLIIFKLYSSSFSSFDLFRVVYQLFNGVVWKLPSLKQRFQSCLAAFPLWLPCFPLIAK